MDYDTVNISEIPKKLVEKHKKALSDAKTTLQNIDRIKILEEKLDQQRHWVDESTGKKKEEYAKKLKASEAELAKLAGETAPHPNITPRQLEEKIKEHEKAIEYWKKQ
jgi:hypothetical protein